VLRPFEKVLCRPSAYANVPLQQDSDDGDGSTAKLIAYAASAYATVLLRQGLDDGDGSTAKLIAYANVPL
jgi:hypothetical protein